jgi:hypothetical protein
MSFSLFSFNPCFMKKTIAVDFVFYVAMILLFYVFFVYVS